MRLLDNIEYVALNHPEKMAYISTDSQLTYGELWQQSNQIAGYLESKKLTKSSPILVYGHMGASMIASFLGSVIGGHPYIPVDISIPHDRILKMVESAQTELIIDTTNELAIDHDVTVVQMEEIMSHSNHVKTGADRIEGDKNFYIIYTSGSTGRPKGVQISANNLQSFVDWMLNDFPIQGGLRFLNQAPYSFDLSVMDIYPALASGGTIFTITKDMIAKPKLLFEALNQSNIQVWTSTPSFVQMCLMDPSFNHNLLPELSVFLFCGEILPVAICQQLKERFPHAKIFNTYGPTEATVAVTSLEITQEILKNYQTLPIGKSKMDTNIILLDEHGNQVPSGETGEIVIVGPGVSKGYLGQLELTKKAFFDVDGQRAYRTGDAGYEDETGLLFYKGRIDFQIKLHGYRMELEEIEYHIAKSIYVKSAAVIPVYQKDKIEFLMAVVVPGEHHFEKEYQLTSAIKKELGEMIPAYMIPKKFFYQEDLPLTPNGKLDRKMIRELVMQ
ncbi:D-alanine--poly(phosphoribitol) ligase subunit DltA [Bacillus sp. JJ1764]|uniref:D-alanine--poly(phosphoribitol) ligase subunit DltA n=1 Tax=Bacillus sp. JJ1764 TaxID=3122964 RepID=UPI002FFF7204